MSADSKRKSVKTARRSQNHIDRVGKPLGAQSGAGVKVAQGYSMAGVWLRLAALLYDFLLVAAVVLVVSVILIAIGGVLFSISGQSPSEAQTLPTWYRYWIMAPAIFGSVYGFYALLWTKSGQTLGMQTWRIMVVARTGKYLTYRESLQRCGAALILPVVLYLVTRIGLDDAQHALKALFIGFLFNYVFAALHPQKRSPQDLLSSSLVLKVARRQGGLISDIRGRFRKS